MLSVCVRSVNPITNQPQIAFIKMAAPVSAPVAAEPKKRSPRNGMLSVTEMFAEQEENNADLRDEMNQARKEFAALAVECLPSLSVLRLSKGMSQTKLAQLVKTSQSHIARIEAKSLAVSLETAYKIANALDVSMDQVTPLLLQEPKELHPTVVES